MTYCHEIVIPPPRTDNGRHIGRAVPVFLSDERLPRREHPKLSGIHEQIGIHDFLFVDGLGFLFHD